MWLTWMCKQLHRKLAGLRLGRCSTGDHVAYTVLEVGQPVKFVGVHGLQDQRHVF